MALSVTISYSEQATWHLRLVPMDRASLIVERVASSLRPDGEGLREVGRLHQYHLQSATVSYYPLLSVPA